MTFLIGICIGSFVQCLIDRYPHCMASARSRCPVCNHLLSYYDLFPVLSYCLLSGRCRYCNATIPGSSLCTEVFFGFFYLFLFSSSISFQQIMLIALLMPFFYLASAVDLKTGEIPDLCSAVLFCSALLFSSVHMPDACIASMICIFCVRFGWLGAGDAKLIAAFTFLSGSSIVFALWSASVFCILYSLFRKEKKRHIPFAPFLCLGFLLCLFLF